MAGWKMALLNMALLCFSAMFNRAQASCGDFSASCTAPFSFTGSILSANCANTAEEYKSSSLGLNSHLSNNNGNLVEGSDFAASCSSDGYSDVSGSVFYIHAFCKKEDGSPHATFYNVDNNVVNNDGTLVWNNCRRRALLESTPVNAGDKEAKSNADQGIALGVRKLFQG